MNSILSSSLHHAMSRTVSRAYMALVEMVTVVKKYSYSMLLLATGSTERLAYRLDDEYSVTRFSVTTSNALLYGTRRGGELTLSRYASRGAQGATVRLYNARDMFLLVRFGRRLRAESSYLDATAFCNRHASALAGLTPLELLRLMYLTGEVTAKQVCEHVALRDGEVALTYIPMDHWEEIELSPGDPFVCI